MEGRRSEGKFLKGRPNPPPSLVNTALLGFVDGIYGARGLKEAEENMEEARKKLGAENWTRDMDADELKGCRT